MNTWTWAWEVGRCGAGRREVLRKTHCLVRVGVGSSDGCHYSNPSFHTITKVPSVCRVKAVFMMGIDKCVKEAQNHNAILKASQEHTGDQVMEMISQWQYRSMSPER